MCVCNIFDNIRLPYELIVPLALNMYTYLLIVGLARGLPLSLHAYYFVLQMTWLVHEGEWSFVNII